MAINGATINSNIRNLFSDFMESINSSGKFQHISMKTGKTVARLEFAGLNGDTEYLFGMTDMGEDRKLSMHFKKAECSYSQAGNKVQADGMADILRRKLAWAANGSDLGGHMYFRGDSIVESHEDMSDYEDLMAAYREACAFCNVSDIHEMDAYVTAHPEVLRSNEQIRDIVESYTEEDKSKDFEMFDAFDEIMAQDTYQSIKSKLAHLEQSLLRLDKDLGAGKAGVNGPVDLNAYIDNPEDLMAFNMICLYSSIEGVTDPGKALNIRRNLLNTNLRREASSENSRSIITAFCGKYGIDRADHAYNNTRTLGDSVMADRAETNVIYRLYYDDRKDPGKRIVDQEHKALQLPVCVAGYDAEKDRWYIAYGGRAMSVDEFRADKNGPIGEFLFLKDASSDRITDTLTKIAIGADKKHPKDSAVYHIDLMAVDMELFAQSKDKDVVDAKKRLSKEYVSEVRKAFEDDIYRMRMCAIVGRPDVLTKFDAGFALDPWQARMGLLATGEDRDMAVCALLSGEMIPENELSSGNKYVRDAMNVRRKDAAMRLFDTGNLPPKYAEARTAFYDIVGEYKGIIRGDGPASEKALAKLRLNDFVLMADVYHIKSAEGYRALNEDIKSPGQERIYRPQDIVEASILRTLYKNDGTEDGCPVKVSKGAAFDQALQKAVYTVSDANGLSIACVGESFEKDGISCDAAMNKLRDASLTYDTSHKGHFNQICNRLVHDDPMFAKPKAPSAESARNDLMQSLGLQDEWQQYQYRTNDQGLGE